MDTEEIAYLLDALEDMCYQHCEGMNDKIDSMAISANADALRLLAEYGRFIIEHEAGRRVIGHFNVHSK